MTRTVPELAFYCPNFYAKPTRKRLMQGTRFSVNEDRMHHGSSVELGIKPAILKSQGRDTIHQVEKYDATSVKGKRWKERPVYKI
ncbi:hypothetical protein AVEN_231016-1 [Araneus ventricosus]|uniref:Uncharacterized protein n=1 Tax=Araneus ventricosus TaxID=182803 RepID=A0A4Y2A361_ARAVE|nr:hypothetical protein AVEN_231016-1 [Araneus ventricosus]